MIQLSKSRYMAGLQCLKRLWLEVHEPGLKRYDESRRAILDMGAEVGAHAQKLYPRGVLIEEDFRHLPEAIQSTRKAVEEGAVTMFEPAAEHGQVVARADILTRWGGLEDEWDMIEVKSVLAVKEYQVHDMAIQKWIFEGAGYRIRKSALCHINKEYVRQGEIEWRKFFKLSDISAEVARLTPGVGKKVGEFLEIAGESQAPDVPVGSRCHSPYDCPFIHHCWRGLPPDNVFDLCWARGLPDKLYEKGVVLLRDIPDDVKLNKNQKIQVEIAKTGKVVWDDTAVRGFLRQVKYPVQFLDFEADNPTIPLYDGTTPKQKIPFQYSLHILESPGAELIHHAFLGDGVSDPRELLAESLARDLRREGSVVAYSAGYEKEVMLKLADLFPKQAAAFHSAVKRLVDLETPFRNRHIAHPGFRGSSSLKVVLPSLVPEMSYAGLAVPDGMSAVSAYQRMSKPETPAAEKEKIRGDLLQYCGQDTLAMVRLFEVLSQKPVGYGFSGASGNPPDVIEPVPDPDRGT